MHAPLYAGELLDTLPPGVDEVVAISKVVSFLKAPEYQKFTRIILDTAPTGHTLRLLTLPDFIDATVGKVIRLRAKLTNAAAAVKGFFGVKAERDQAVVKLEALKVWAFRLVDTHMRVKDCIGPQSRDSRKVSAEVVDIQGV